MCGVCGWVRFDGRPVASEPLTSACVAMRHRGPDDSGVWTSASSGSSGGLSIGLGAVRLAILDPTPAGHQPMTDPTGRYALVYNGEVYNFREIRRTLAGEGHRFVTDCDTEVVLAACMHWGEDALSKLNGMWSLAFVDTSSGVGFLSRDRFGIKPLMYAKWGDSLAFASELRALSAFDGWDRSIDPDALAQHVQFGYIAHPATIHRGARRLPPGHLLRFTTDGVDEPRPYYSLSSAAGRATPPDAAEAPRVLRRLLSESVVRRRVSDVPIGAFLSGGLDSSIIVAHLAEASGRAIQTFAVGYADRGAYDETRYARLVAERFGTEHHELLLTDADVLDCIPTVLDHLGEPVGDSSIIPTALVSEFAAGRVTVALSGDGGDELFGGYWRYLGHDAWSAYHRLPGWLRRAIIDPGARMLASSKGGAIANRVRQFRKLTRTTADDPLHRHIAWSRILSPDAESLLSDSSTCAQIDAEMYDRAMGLSAGFPGDDPLARIMAFDLQYGLPADMLQKVDLASMMHSLEVRVPFLDPQLVAEVAGWPSSLKIRGGLRKRVLVDAYRGRLPDCVLDRAKMGFELPIGEYLRGPLDGMFRDVVTRQRIESVGLLSWAGVERVHADHLARRGEHADVLFSLLSLCWWLGRSTPGTFQKS